MKNMAPPTSTFSSVKEKVDVASEYIHIVEFTKQTAPPAIAELLMKVTLALAQTDELSIL